MSWSKPVYFFNIPLLFYFWWVTILVYPCRSAGRSVGLQLHKQLILMRKKRRILFCAWGNQCMCWSTSERDKRITQNGSSQGISLLQTYSTLLVWLCYSDDQESSKRKLAHSALYDIPQEVTLTWSLTSELWGYVHSIACPWVMVNNDSARSVYAPVHPGPQHNPCYPRIVSPHMLNG